MNVSTKPLKAQIFKEAIQQMIEQEDWNLAGVALILAKATRVGDVLKTITIGDVFTRSGELQEYISFKEEKTGKPKLIPLNGVMIRKVLLRLWLLNDLSSKSPSAPIFYSRKGLVSGVPLSTTHVNRKLKEYGTEGEQISSHSIRKTAGRAMLESGENLAVIQKLYNHSSYVTTLKYLGVNNQDVEKAYKSLEF